MRAERCAAAGQAQSELLPLPLDEVRMFTEALDRIRMAYVEEIDDKTLLENVQSDPHSAYMAGQDYTPFRKPLLANSVGWASRWVGRTATSR